MKPSHLTTPRTMNECVFMLNADPIERPEHHAHLPRWVKWFGVAVVGMAHLVSQARAALSTPAQQDAVDARPLTIRELAELTAPWANVWTDASFGIANAAIEKFCEVNGIQRRLT